MSNEPVFPAPVYNPRTHKYETVVRVGSGASRECAAWTFDACVRLARALWVTLATGVPVKRAATTRLPAHERPGASPVHGRAPAHPYYR